MSRLLPLITRDPVTGEELLATRLESPSGMVIEGQFSLGWLAKLTTDQIDFIGLFVKNRGNVQKLAADLNIAYNTARNRLDDIVVALGAPPEPPERADRRQLLERLNSGELDFETAMQLLEGEGG